MHSSNYTARRNFIKQSATVISGLFLAENLKALPFSMGPVFGGVKIGVITYSFRSLPGSIHDILTYCKQSGVNAIELMGEAVEAYAGIPTEVSGSKDDKEKAIRIWREAVSMEKFVEVRKMFNKAGISIYAFKPNALQERHADTEIAYAMKAAKALGATSVTVELPNNSAQSKRLGEIAAKHKIYVGYHTHTQATDTIWDEALSQSPYNSINLDCGHYIAAGGNNTKESLLAFIEAKFDRITSMHIKDRQSKINGGANLEWGRGDTPIREILQLMKRKKYSFPATIELEYPVPSGSDAVKEVAKCLQYARQALSS